MGHRSAQMTEQVYTHQDSRALGEKIWRLQPLLPQGFTPNRGRKTAKTEGKSVEVNADGRYLESATFSKETSATDSDSNSGRPDPLGDERRNSPLASAGRPEGESHQRGPPPTVADRTEAIGSNPITPIQGSNDPGLIEVIRAQQRAIDALSATVVRLLEGADREREHRREIKDG